MNLKLTAVLAISILMLLTVAGCCYPTPFWIGDGSDTNVTSEKPAVAPKTTDFAWTNDLDAGLKKAAAEGKPVFLDFWGGG